MRDVVVRWTSNRKIEVIKAFDQGVMSKEELLAKYNLTDEEFTRWQLLYHKHGASGLRTIWAQRYKTPA